MSVRCDNHIHATSATGTVMRYPTAMCASIGGYISEEIHHAPRIIDIIPSWYTLSVWEMQMIACITLPAATFFPFVQPSPLSPSQPSTLTSLDGNYSSLIASIRNTTKSSLGVDSLNTQCSEQFGVNPMFSDCQSAREHISTDVVEYFWGARHTGLPGNVFPLPYRIMGCKFCPVQLFSYV